MNVLSLFSGVGMMDYGLERAGFNTVAFCEIEPWPRRVLNKHWPDVPVYEDVRELNRERLKEDRIGSIDVIVGGWPCQDLSVAGKQAGIHDGKRSGLWSECARLVSELRPKYAIFENVGALLSGGDLVDTPSGPVYRTWFGRVLRDLAEIGYDCEWHCIPAGNPDGLSAGAPHRRERIWIVAYPNVQQQPERRRGDSDQRNETPDGEGPGVTGNQGVQGRDVANPISQRGRSGNASSKDVAHNNVNRCDQRGQGITKAGSNGVIGNDGRPTEPGFCLLAHGIAARLSGSRWLPEPPVGRVATGVPDRVQKLKALGNGLVWQIPYAIGRAIMECES